MRLSQSNRALLRHTPGPRHNLFRRPTRDITLFVFVICICLLASGCRSSHDSNKPSILFTRLPSAQTSGGPALLDQIKGSVVNGKPGSQVVIYTLSHGTWWVQPFRSHPLTEIGSDGRWANATHFGTDYAAILVAAGYQPAAKLTALPPVSGSVLAVAASKGSSEALAAPKMLHFSGYDWKIRSFPDDLGGDICNYEPSNVWTDDRGYLHLLMGQGDGQWQCAAVSLTRSLGYGTYRFLISDSSHLPPSAVFAMFTSADNENPEDKTNMNIDLSQWGKADHANVDFVVQPYYIPENTVNFDAPAGPMTYLLRWEPGSATFRAFARASASPSSYVAEHVFKSGIPEPSTETIHFNLYDFEHSQSELQHPVEIVVQKFEYLP
jgi:hypothetical protein